MHDTEPTRPRRELLAPPESYVKNYKHALKEQRIALKGGGILDKALSAAFGWDPMPATRYNEAMRGVDRERKRAQQYSVDNLDLLKAQAKAEAEAKPEDGGSGKEVHPI